MLRGQVAIVTGAARGIGFSIAKMFASNGAKVVISDVLEEQGIQAAKLLSDNSKTEVAFIKADVSNLKDAENLVQNTIKKFGSVDILINNAGITRDNLIMRMKELEWDQVINVNLKGVFNCIRSVTRQMLKQKHGKIINIASVVGIMGNAGQINYSAAKAGVIGMTKTTAKELGSRGICVNAIAPGFIQSDMTDKMSDLARKNLTDIIPLQRLGQGEDVAKLAIFLASDNSDYITGQTINVDGGMVM